MSTDNRRKQPRRPKSPPSLFLPSETPSPSTRPPKPLIKLESKKQKAGSGDSKSGRWKVRNPFHKIPARTENDDRLPSGAMAITPYPLPVSLQPDASPHPRAFSTHSHPRSPSLPPPASPLLEPPRLGDPALRTRSRAGSSQPDTASNWGGSGRDTLSYLSTPPSPPPPFMEPSHHDEPVFGTRVDMLQVDNRSTWSGSGRDTHPYFNSSSSPVPSSFLEPSYESDRVLETHVDSLQTRSPSIWDGSSSDTLSLGRSASPTLLPPSSLAPLRQRDSGLGTRNRVDSFQTDSTFAWDGNRRGSFSSRSSFSEMQGYGRPVPLPSKLGMGSRVDMYSDSSSSSTGLRDEATNRPEEIIPIHPRPPPATIVAPAEPPPFNSLKIECGTLDQGETFGRKLGGTSDKSKSRTNSLAEGGKPMDMDDIVSRLRSLR
ncbi:hypothetical protein DL96DRAFT_805648 [Flagelloscypha sp. PMI_526]|nr:hypothetical protein DL96DRAFT_805648 [Flagelloscypha sp. PMI_526]